MHIDDAILSRKSVRRFLDTPVPLATVKHIISIAGYSPSGNNIQPWKVYVVAGDTRQQLCNAMLAAFDSGNTDYQPEYTYYPSHWFEPYQSRRKRTGFGLYAALGIKREDFQARQTQMRRNYQLFDAPVGIIVTLDRRLETGSFIDTGMFIQSLMLAARGQGLHTCAQAALAWYQRIIRQHLPLEESELVVCGIALGHEAPQAAENLFRTEREECDNIASFYGF